MSDWKKRQNQLLAVFIVVLGIAYSRLEILQAPSLFVWDSWVRLAERVSDSHHKTDSPDFPILILSIDDSSLERMNLRWPWGRETMAALLDRMAPYHPRVVAFDLTFVGESPYRQADELLAQAIQRSEPIVIAAFFDEKGRLVSPYEPIRTAAGRVGFVNLRLSQDGAVRELIAVAVTSAQKIIAPSLAFEAALTYKGASKVEVTRRETMWGARHFVTYVGADGRGRRIPTGRTYEVGMSFPIEPSKIPRLSFADAMTDDKAIEKVRGKIVFIGLEAPIFQDAHQTPFGKISGVSIQAAGCYMFLRGASTWTAPAFMPWVLFIFACVAAAFLTTRFRRFASLVLSGTLAFSLLAFSAFIFLRWQMWLNPAPAVEGVIAWAILVVLFQDTTHMVEIIRLKNQVAKDPLTDVYTYRYFELLTDSILRKKEPKELVALVVFDIDHFKDINDTHGHAVGNDVIKYFASVLKKSARHRDIVGRFGGDEFCVTMFAKDKDAVVKYLSRIRQEIKEHAKNAANVPGFAFSAGAVIARDYSSRSDLLFKEADKALYRSKLSGRDCHEVVVI